MIEFNEWFEYKDGDLYWKKVTTNRVKIGSKVGSKHNAGYLQTALLGKPYLLHRIIFSMQNGYIPKEIDHIDGNRQNNKIENLREVTRSENNWNQKLSIKNTSGIKGVNWNKKTKKWSARLKILGKVKTFGEYFDKEVAKFIVETMRHKYHKEFTNHG